MEFDVIERPFLTGLNWLDGGDGGLEEDWRRIRKLADDFRTSGWIQHASMLVPVAPGCPV
jgi:hypothetical protein